MTPASSSIDFAPLILALAGLITSFGGAIVWYVRFVLNKQSQLFDDALKRNMELSNTLNATQQHNARLAENNRAMKDDIQELRDKLDKLQRQFEEIQGQRDSERRKAEQRAVEYQNEIIKRDRTITALRDEIADFKRQLATVNERLNTMNTDYAAVVTERDKLRKETEALAELVATLQRENAAVTKHNSELDDKVRTMQRDLELLKAQTALPPAPSPELIAAKRGTNEVKVVKPTLRPEDVEPSGDDAA